MKRAYADRVPLPPPLPPVKRSLPRFSFDEAPTRPRGAIVAPVTAAALAPSRPRPPVVTYASGVMPKVRLASGPPPLPSTLPPPPVRCTSKPPPLPVVEAAMPFDLVRVKTAPPPAPACAADDRPTLLPSLLGAPAKPKRWKTTMALLVLVVAGVVAWTDGSSLAVTATSAFERVLAYLSEHGPLS